MNFVKTSVLKTEFTSEGVKETEIEAKSDEQIATEAMLSKLPEFNRDPQFRSLSEQIYDNQAQDSQEKSKENDTQEPKYPVASVTEEEFEFYEALDSKEKGLALKRQKEDEDIKMEFAKARNMLHKPTENRIELPFSRKRRTESKNNPNQHKTGTQINLFSSTKTETTAKDFVALRSSPIINKKLKPETPQGSQSPPAYKEQNIKSDYSVFANILNYDSGSESSD